MKFLNFKTVTIAAAAAASMALASAAPTGVNGTLDTGTLSGETVTVSPTSITFNPNTGATGTNITVDTIDGVPPLTDNGAPVVATTGYVMSLTAPGSFPVNNFIQLNGTTIDYTLSGIGSETAPGVTTPASTNGTDCNLTSTSQSCIVVAGSPFLLTYDGPNTTTVKLFVNGTVYDTALVGAGQPVTPYDGTFSTDISMTAAQIQSIELAGGSVTSTHSGTFTATAVPEPTTAFLGLSGLLMAAGLYRRRSQKKS